MIKRILVPLDGSETAEAVLTQVRQVVKKHDAEVVLLNVFVPFAPGLDTPLSTGMVQTMVAELNEASRQYIESAAQRLAATGIKARAVHAAGTAAHAILDVAEREEASLIAMSTHGRSGVARFAFGSVAEKVLRSSHVPVLLVRSFDDGKPVPATERPFRNILIPLDGSGLALGAVTRICEFARPLDARVVLLHVLPSSDLPLHWTPEPPSMKVAHQELSEACIPAETVVTSGDPAAGILNICAERKCDMIAMTTHGRSGPSRWVFGSVTEKVLRASSVPMYVIPGKKGTKP